LRLGQSNSYNGGLINCDTDIGELLNLVPGWAAQIRDAKAQIAPRDFEWYPYDTLGNLRHLDQLLTGSNRRVLELIGDQTLLDLGCGDGELSLFFAALGCKVVSMDYGPTNHNEMRGIRSLKEKLQASIEIVGVDFDSQFSLDGIEAGVALLLGVLYHLKNPFYVLEKLSKHSKYCIMSTKIANCLPDQRTSIAKWPIGYLLAADELNQDNSNFWIFSEAGFKRLLERTNWAILDYWKSPGVENSSPDSVDRDQRVFCLARSTYGITNIVLLNGWHEPESSGWRWTRRCFSIEVPSPPARPRALHFEVYVSRECLQEGRLSLVATSGSTHLFTQDFDQAGKQPIVRRVAFPKDQPNTNLRIDFELNHALRPDEHDSRERGIIFSRMRLD
jgi:SAM-dependent methyltransferase